MRNPAWVDAAYLVDAVRQALDRPGLLTELGAIYAEVDRLVALSGMTCRACGRCCDFPAAGHFLYATPAELAYLALRKPPKPDAGNHGLCPYSEHGRCTARDARTLGCRVFFCQANHDSTDFDPYERFHGRIVATHRTHCTPYAYVELTAALMQLFTASELRGKILLDE